MHTHTRVVTHTLPQTKGPILRRGRRFYALTGSAGRSLRRSDRFPIFTLGFHIPSFRALAFIVFLNLPAFSSRHSRCRCETGRNRTHLLCNLLREQELWGVRKFSSTAMLLLVCSSASRICFCLLLVNVRPNFAEASEGGKEVCGNLRSCGRQGEAAE